jgi:hypothetical protein
MRFEFLTIDYDDCPVGEAPARFGFECPGGKMGPGGLCSGLLIRGQGHDIPNQTWTWNGDREKPTFTPSINCVGCSHGFITDGVWRDA